MYYDRNGKPINRSEFAKRHDDFEYKVLARTTLPDGRFVSTVWLGIDHAFGEQPPLIFETMVFPERGNWHEEDCDRYATEAEARAGHEAMVAKWSAPKASGFEFL